MRLNVIWILIEGMRNFYTEDDYTRAKSIELIANEGIEFTNTITSAPSTVMSTSAMLSGIPAYYGRRAYNEEAFSKEKTLLPILEQNGYNIKSVLWLEILNKTFWYLNPVILPPDERLSLKGKLWREWFPANIINQAALKLIKAAKRPFFLLINYPPPGRLNTDQDIGDFITTLKAMDIYNRSLVMISSDHGRYYPVPPLEIREKRGHDEWVDENSIRIPLIIKHPKFPTKKIDQLTSTLDIFPTILDFLDIDLTNYKNLSIKGKSLLPLIEGKEIEDERMVRVDTRYLFQPARTTAIRGEKFKYIIYHDEEKEEFFDIKNDPQEKNNLIDSCKESLKEVISRYREEFKRSEEEAINSTGGFARGSNQEITQKEIIQKCQNVDLQNRELEVLLFKSTRLFHLESILEVIKDLFPKIDVFIQQNVPKDFKNSQLVRNFIDWGKGHFNYAKFKKDYPDLAEKRYDVVIVPISIPWEREQYEEVFKIARALNRGVIISIAYNMSVRREGG